MPEGDREFSKRLRRIEEIASKIEIPIIVKEVGFGISKETAYQLRDVGIKYIDVGGYGGTSFSKIENKRRENAVNVFNQWGIPTVASLVEVKNAVPECYILASGGLRHGLDGVKSLVLGASLFGMAGSLLKILIEDGIDALKDEVSAVHESLKIAMLTLGARTPSELEGLPHVFFGKVKEWIEQRI
jgi:isopentenyl-diphosphate Delta-isomerase